MMPEATGQGVVAMRRCSGGMVLVLGPALGVVLGLAGCSKRGEDQFIPPEALARQALETALKAWQGGQAKPERLSLGIWIPFNSGAGQQCWTRRSRAGLPGS